MTANFWMVVYKMGIYPILWQARTHWCAHGHCIGSSWWAGWYHPPPGEVWTAGHLRCPLWWWWNISLESEALSLSDPRAAPRPAHSHPLQTEHKHINKMMYRKAEEVSDICYTSVRGRKWTQISETGWRTRWCAWKSMHTAQYGGNRPISLLYSLSLSGL